MKPLKTSPKAHRASQHPAAKPAMTVTEMASLGGKACAKSRTPQERQRVARKAVTTRWKRHRAAVRALRKPTPAPGANGTP